MGNISELTHCIYSIQYPKHNTTLKRSLTPYYRSNYLTEENLYILQSWILGKIFLSFGAIVTSDSPSVLLHRQSSLADDLSEFVPARRHLFIPTLIWEYQRAKDSLLVVFTCCMMWGKKDTGINSPQGSMFIGKVEPSIRDKCCNPPQRHH